MKLQKLNNLWTIVDMWHGWLLNKVSSLSLRMCDQHSAMFPNGYHAEIHHENKSKNVHQLLFRIYSTAS